MGSRLYQCFLMVKFKIYFSLSPCKSSLCHDSRFRCRIESIKKYFPDVENSYVTPMIFMLGLIYNLVFGEQATEVRKAMTRQSEAYRLTISTKSSSPEAVIPK